MVRIYYFYGLLTSLKYRNFVIFLDVKTMFVFDTPKRFTCLCYQPYKLDRGYFAPSTSTIFTSYAFFYSFRLSTSFIRGCLVEKWATNRCISAIRRPPIGGLLNVWFLQLSYIHILEKNAHIGVASWRYPNKKNTRLFGCILNDSM